MWIFFNHSEKLSTLNDVDFLTDCTIMNVYSKFINSTNFEKQKHPNMSKTCGTGNRTFCRIFARQRNFIPTTIAQPRHSNKSPVINLFLFSLSVLMSKMELPPAAITTWTGPARVWSFRTCRSGGSPSCTSRTQTLKCPQSPCPGTRPLPAKQGK